ncbi:hypothetical protein LTR48_003074 [Friedmanniomyces endolithicus]|nr:hypothetical protein LTR48_003074 [Friedmanniomyces endolithicus]
MSLYHEAASILDETRAKKCSIKSLVYTTKKGKEWKSDPKALFALSTEAAKWSEVLAEVAGRSGVLGVERTVSRDRFACEPWATYGGLEAQGEAFCGADEGEIAEGLRYD